MFSVLENYSKTKNEGNGDEIFAGLGQKVTMSNTVLFVSQ